MVYCIKGLGAEILKHITCNVGLDFLLHDPCSMIHEFMFHFLKFIIWFAGVAVIVYFALPLFGYAVNTNYFNESASQCQKIFNDCSKNIINKGTKSENCNLRCVNSGLIFKKR